MKKRGFLFNASVVALLLAVCVTAARAQQLSNCPASPYPVTVQQADGSLLTIVGKGTMLKSWTETADGYTVVKRAGRFEYATKKDGKLVPTGVPARNAGERMPAEVNFLRQRSKSLRPDVSPFGDMPGRARAASDTQQPVAGYPTKGNIRALLLLIKFPNMSNQYKVEDFNNLMNGTKYRGTGSFRDFFAAGSNGQLNVTTDVFGWYTASNPYLYYGYGNDFYVSTELVREAVDAAQAAGVDFSKYDNDGDGRADGIIVAHAGPGAEEGGLEDYIWSHRWVLSAGGKSVTYDGVLVNDYIINPERRLYTKQMTGRGVFCHEFGHNLGLPDLYDTDGGSEGLGEWSLMAGGGWLGNEHTPGNMCAWSKQDLKWISPTVITANGSYTLPPASSSDLVYRINTPVANEYFLLENRQKTGLDTSLPGSGLAIFHINTSMTTGLVRNRNRVNADVNNKGVDLEEADGQDNMDNGWNRGDEGDLYPCSFTGNKDFNDASSPNSKTGDMASSRIGISGIALENGNNISFTVDLNSTPTLPVITSFIPTSGPAGTGVAIKGTNFRNVTAVKFNGEAATQFYVANTGLLFATVPEGASSGKISVEATGTATSASSFTVGSVRSAWETEEELTTARSQHGAVAANGRIYVFGGTGTRGALKSVEIYNPGSDSWKSGASMPAARRGVSYATGTDGAIYVIGGADTDPSGSLYRYTPSSNSWTTLASMPAGVLSGAAVAHNGRIYVFGGVSSGGGTTNSTRIYDIAANQWSDGAPMPVAVQQHGAVTGIDGRIYVLGGRSTSDGGPTGLVQVYNPAANTWSAGTEMPVPKVQFGLVTASDGRIYVVGGKARGGTSAGPFFNSVEIYTPWNDQWAQGPVIPMPVGELVAVRLNDNLYAVGGASGKPRKYNFKLNMPPAAPALLTAVPVSSSQIRLEWTDRARNESKYVVERATAEAGPYTIIAGSLDKNTTRYTSSGLAAGTAYYFRVKAANGVGNSAYCRTAEARTPGISAGLVPAATSANERRTVLTNSLTVNPNPAGKSTRVAFSVAEDQQQVQLGIYDLQGKLVKQLYRGPATAGMVLRFDWDAGKQAAGVYFSRLVTAKGVFTQKIILGAGGR